MKYIPTPFLILGLTLAGCGGADSTDVVSDYLASESYLYTLECECFWDEVIFDEPLYDSLESCLDESVLYAAAVEACLRKAPEDVQEEIADVLACTDAVNRDWFAKFEPLGCDFEGISEEEEAAFDARWDECDQLPGAEYVQQCTGFSLSCNAEGECVQCSAGECVECTAGQCPEL